MTGFEFFVAGMVMQILASVEELRSACPPYYRVMLILLRATGILLIVLSAFRGN